MKKFDPQNLQLKYEKWRSLYNKLQEAQEHWTEAEHIWDELMDYYQNKQWLEDHDSIQKLSCNQHEYSILDEDTLWNALEERRLQALKWMRLSLDTIEK
ncbi:TPA: DUF4298 domain-containing protein [Acinetobacter nosocomialis]|nr:DUF4298 domain-containing protein [Acinetobacter nosocomialis]